MEAHIKKKFPYLYALEIAEQIKSKCEPYCHKIVIAGSLRRKKDFVSDIEIVAIPKPYESGLFENGLASIVNSFKKIKGDMIYRETKYAQRELSISLHSPREKIKIDFFMADEINWGYILCLRTGSKNFNFNYVNTLKARGYRLDGGYVWYRDKKVTIPDEESLFSRSGMKYLLPEARI